MFRIEISRVSSWAKQLRCARITSKEYIVIIAASFGLNRFGFDEHVIRLVSRMRSHVPRDHVAAAGGVGALWTLVGLLAGVGALMSGEVIGAREDLPAHAARVRFDARVQSHVAGEHVAARKGPLTYLAKVRLCGAIA